MYVLGEVAGALSMGDAATWPRAIQSSTARASRPRSRASSPRSLPRPSATWRRPGTKQTGRALLACPASFADLQLERLVRRFPSTRDRLSSLDLRREPRRHLRRIQHRRRHRVTQTRKMGGCTTAPGEPADAHHRRRRLRDDAPVELGIGYAIEQRPLGPSRQLGRLHAEIPAWKRARDAARPPLCELASETDIFGLVCELVRGNTLACSRRRRRRRRRVHAAAHAHLFLLLPPPSSPPPRRRRAATHHRRRRRPSPARRHAVEVAGACRRLREDRHPVRRDRGPRPSKTASNFRRRLVLALAALVESISAASATACSSLFWSAKDQALGASSSAIFVVSP